jgi:FO synthase
MTVKDLSRAGAGEILLRTTQTPLADLQAHAAALRDAGHGRRLSYSRKVFIPLTKACRDVCHYCTFAEPPSKERSPYLSRDEVLAIARAGAAAGCNEALFTLGDKPELRYRAAADALSKLGFASTLSYLAAMCEAVLNLTGLLPHVNPGVMSAEDIAALRPVSVSMGLMLESASRRLCGRGQVHFGSPDKEPHVRLETMRLAGQHRVPFTTGILIGIGETRLERIEALLAIAGLHRRFGHIQEVIIQNFRAKPGTKAATASEPDLDDLLWTIAVARLLFGPAMNIQAPPNLSPEEYPRLIGAGLNDWGGVSPVTPDFVNPEAPWPAIAALADAAAAAGKVLVERLPVYPTYATDMEWIAPRLHRVVLRASDAEGYARLDDWSPGLPLAADRALPRRSNPIDAELKQIVGRAERGARLRQAEIIKLFGAREADFAYVAAAADDMRAVVCGETVHYVVNRNINYTNICFLHCEFCAFSKGKTSAALRGAPYDLAISEIVRRTREAWARGATEVCMQGGIHPDYTGATYLAICRAVKRAVPRMHIHAFSPLEVRHGAATTNLSVPEFLAALKEAGLGSLPGTAAEILDTRIRRMICPDKLTAAEWLSVIEAAHEIGLRTTATIMFGHVDDPPSWARHLLAIRDLQARTGGFTEFVPLPFVPMEAPIFAKGKSRAGPTLRESILMHAVARLVLNPLVVNIQASWVKLGIGGVKMCLAAGANDLGGTLMNESISRAAGTQHGQELAPAAMRDIARSAGRKAAQRDTLYRPAPQEREAAGLNAPPLTSASQTSPLDPLALSRLQFATGRAELIE